MFTLLVGSDISAFLLQLLGMLSDVYTPGFDIQSKFCLRSAFRADGAMEFGPRLVQPSTLDAISPGCMKTAVSQPVNCCSRVAISFSAPHLAVI